VGTIRVTRGEGYYKLSRLVVLKDFRRYRFGGKLVEFHREWVRQDARASGHSDAVIRCHSQLYVRQFYAK
jgi:GNAT superfamily N-acetyltransferase